MWSDRVPVLTVPLCRDIRHNRRLTYLDSSNIRLIMLALVNSTGHQTTGVYHTLIQYKLIFLLSACERMVCSQSLSFQFVVYLLRPYWQGDIFISTLRCGPCVPSIWLVLKLLLQLPCPCLGLENVALLQSVILKMHSKTWNAVYYFFRSHDS